MRFLEGDNNKEDGRRAGYGTGIELTSLVYLITTRGHGRHDTSKRGSVTDAISVDNILYFISLSSGINSTALVQGRAKCNLSNR